MYNLRVETFIRVAEAGSFNKAAEAMYISPPAVIKQVNGLEADLGVHLFERTHRGLILTAAGKSFYKDARRITRDFDEAVRRAKEIGHMGDMVIRIGTSPLAPAHVLMKYFPKSKKGEPQFSIKIVNYEGTLEETNQYFSNLGDKMDIIPAIYDEALLQFRNCQGIEIFRSPFYAAVSMDNPLFEKDSVTLEDLKGQTVHFIQEGRIHDSDLLRKKVEEEYPEVHVSLFPFYDMNLFNRIAENGEVLIAFSTMKYMHPLLKFIPLDYPVQVPFGLLYSKTPEKKVLRFIEAVQKSLPSVHS
ncbi:LysR family transcriptional regulator [Dialister sp.]|uniref:LysR family transcriptional regulator n=1 Tax=Dialister sp. TaxID=1955814 RepID=UPI003F0E862C